MYGLHQCVRKLVRISHIFFALLLRCLPFA